MQIVIYAHPFDGSARNVLKCLRDRYDGPDTIYLPEVKDVEPHLRKPAYMEKLLVLMPRDRRELDDLIAISDLMRDAKLILVLPEDDPVINEQSHLMRPRFVSYIDCDPSRLIMVIDRILKADSTWPVKAAQ